MMECKHQEWCLYVREVSEHLSVHARMRMRAH